MIGPYPEGYLETCAEKVLVAIMQCPGPDGLATQHSMRTTLKILEAAKRGAVFGKQPHPAITNMLKAQS